MKILALEFSSLQRSVALVQQRDSSAALVECEVVETGAGSNKPFAMIEEVLRQSGIEREQVERLAVGLGPGSYTGIRAGIALAQGWQLGLGTPICGLSSADCVAAGALAEGLMGRIVVVMDAQRGEFYQAVYELRAGSWRELEPLRLAAPASIAKLERDGVLVVGPEVTRWFPQGRNIFPRASVLGRLALEQTRFTPGENLQPIYLRPTTFVKAPLPRVLPE